MSGRTRRNRLHLAALTAKTGLHTLLLPGAILAAVPYVVTALLPELHAFGPLLPLWGLVAALVAAGGIGAWLSLDFIVMGDGTPNPLDPPRALVTRGLYRYVRNPGYCLVAFILGAEVFYAGSTNLFVYSVVVLAGFHCFVVFVEERGLRERFDGDYETYCENVPRWIPRLLPWHPPGSGAEALGR